MINCQLAGRFSHLLFLKNLSLFLISVNFSLSILKGREKYAILKDENDGTKLQAWMRSCGLLADANSEKRRQQQTK
ncbi:hypothetical protein VNO80_15075 [Phaseolus coccineus]|uniref:Uncharacterized protein n=1 Tax=Phaseolus coccineus TaxID=3886 RepID=A0AAN9MPC3_PHACN